ncbi:hypothetical protein HK098_007191 [Nowakowskiella sp. JEL0407]|nr:hypothetical protein HK098_007191 [Nowakowskiella sp. JEL0407]
MELRMCVTNKSYPISNDRVRSNSDIGEYETSTSCINKIAFLKKPIRTNNDSQKRPNSTHEQEWSATNEFLNSIGIILPIWIITLTWILMIACSYIRNAKLYQERQRNLKLLSDEQRYKKLRHKLLRNLFNLNPEDANSVVRLREKLKSFASGFDEISCLNENHIEKSEVTNYDDFYGQPAEARIAKLGQSGYSWKMLSLIFPRNLIKIGNSTVTINPADGLYLLPEGFTLAVTYRISIHLFTTMFLFSGYLFSTWPFILFAGTPGWMAYFLFSFLLILLKSNTANERGILRLLRSIGETRIQEIMFSYSWNNQRESVRTLAHALWNSGIGVWIDCIKLISGNRLQKNIRRAVKEVNVVVIFLSPEYLKSGNCCVEFEEAIKRPGKLFIHVLSWDEKVRLALRFLVDEIKLPRRHITSHPNSKRWLIKRGFPFRFSKLDDDTIATDEFIHKLETEGQGWREIAAVLHNYTKKYGDIWDFSWWYANTLSGGGIPHQAPCPPNVEKWNLRPFFPLPRFPSFKNIRLFSSFRNVYIREDCGKVGSDGSAFPWKLLIFVFVALLPSLDMYLFFDRQKYLEVYTMDCIDSAKMLNNSEIVRGAFCSKFYDSSSYTRNEYFGFDTAFKKNFVHSAFEEHYKSLNCSGRVYVEPESWRFESALRCVRNLKYQGFISDYIVWTKIIALTGLLFFAIVFNFRTIVDSTKSIPSCLRPLLAVSNLTEETNEKSIMNKLFEFLKFKRTNPSRKRRANRRAETDVEQLDYEARALTPINPDETQSEKLPPTPSVLVKVHGNSSIAKNLRKFFRFLGRSLPDDVEYDIFEYTSPQDKIVENATIIGNVGYGWVNIFVISSPQHLMTLYQRNQMGHIDLTVSVIIVDHQPIPGIINLVTLNEDATNILKPSDAASWLYSVMFIKTREREDGKKDYSSPNLADRILMDVSLRTKDALFKYANKYLKDLKVDDI